MQKKKILAQAITLGLLLAVPCGAMAAEFEDGFNINVNLDESGKHNVGAIAPNKDITINKDISYIFVLNKGAVTTNSGVSSILINNGGKSVTYNNNVNISLSTDLTGTGNNSANGLCVYDGNLTFNGNTEVNVEAKGENGKSAYGIGVVGDAAKNVKPLLNFTGDKLTVNVITDTARQGDPVNPQNKYCETAGISAYNSDVIASENTKVEINVEGTSTEKTASPVYGLLNEAGTIDLKGDTVINVVTHGAGSDKEVMENKDRGGLAVGVKVIDGFYNTTLGNQSGRANTNLNNAIISATNTAIGGRAVGIQTTDFDKDNAEFAQLEINGDLQVDVDADTARGVEIKNGTYAKIGGENTENIVIHAKSSNISSSSTNIGIWAVAGGKADIKTDNLTINVEATGSSFASGLHAQNNTTDVTDLSQIATLNIEANNIVINSKSEADGKANGMAVMSQGIMNVKGNLLVNADNVIVARGGATINVNSDTGNTNITQLNGNISFDYEQTTSGTPVDATVNVKLTGENSYWNGNSQISWDADKSIEADKLLEVNGLSVSLNDGAQWNPNMIKESGEAGTDLQGTMYTALNSLELNDGIINLNSEKLNGQTIKVENLNGEGGTITTNDVKNKVTVTDKSADTSLTVKGVGALDADAVAQDSKVAEALAKTVVSESDTDKSLANKVVAVAGAIRGEYTEELKDGVATGNGTFAVNTDNQAISNMASIGLMTWRAENNDMNKRLGELRNSTGEHGVWVRMVRGESKYGEQNVKNQYNTYQLGYDEKLSTDDHWTVGVAVSYTDGKSSFTNGNGENKHTGLSLYGSYLGDDGSFVDLIAKYARLKHDFEVNGGVGNGDYDTNGYSVSAEYGKRFTKDNGFWLEPQVELTYGKVGSVSYMTDNGASVRQDGMDSLVGRVGFAAGKNINKGNVYLRASYLYDFDGETSVTMTKGASTSFEQDLGGGWWEVGVGTNLSLSNASHLYFDVEKTYGGNVATPWQWNAGVRWSF